MAKTPSQKLFGLIKSLTKMERRYFKLAVNPTGDKRNKYAHLFDAILVQDEFDDVLLQKGIYKDQPIESRKFSELKAYLFKHVLRALQRYDEKTSVDYRIQNHLLNLKVLFKRSLFSECQDELQKIQKLAAQYEQFEALLVCCRWEKELAYAKTDINYLDKHLENISRKEKEYLQSIKALVDLRNLFFRFLIELRKDVSRNEAQLQRLEKITQSPILEKLPETDSYRIQVMYLRIKSVIRFAFNDFDGFYKQSSKLLELMESKPHFLKEDVSEYISALNNHIISCGQLKKYAEVEENLQKLRDIKPLTHDDELKIYRQYYTNRFSFCIKTGDFKEGLDALNEYQKSLEKYKQFAFTKSSFYFQYFYILFANGKFEDALYYLNEWLNQPQNVERKDLQAMARVLNLLIHFEMGNELLLDSLVRSTRRYLRKEKRIYQFEMRFMEFIHDLQKPLSKSEKRAVYQNLLSQFEALKSDPTERRMLRMFDFIAWTKSKIQGVDFEEVVGEKRA